MFPKDFVTADSLMLDLGDGYPKRELEPAGWTFLPRAPMSPVGKFQLAFSGSQRKSQRFHDLPQPPSPFARPDDC